MTFLERLAVTWPFEELFALAAFFLPPEVPEPSAREPTADRGGVADSDPRIPGTPRSSGSASNPRADPSPELTCEACFQDIALSGIDTLGPLNFVAHHHAEEDLLDEVEELRAALSRTLGNAERLLRGVPVRDWDETLAEARRALGRKKQE